MATTRAKAACPATETKVITSIKGFNHKLQCRKFQFEVGKTYEAKGAIKACANGFHAVSMDDLFHAWDFYPIVDDEGRLNRYAITEQSGATDEEKTEKGTKIASASIAIKMELSLPEFIKKAVDRIIELTKGKTADAAGNSAQIGSSGDSARIGSSGNSAQIGSSGDSARIGSSGDSAQIGSSGYSARIGSSGDYARIGSSGDSARIGSSGYSAQIGSSGDYARINSTGRDAVIASAGAGTAVSGIDGTWVSLAEFVDGKCVGFATGCIGKDGLMPNTPYRAKGGRLVEEGQ
ncbi:hypothetical protein [Bosea sp. (in: a-proteobacteria)]|uniref:DUF7666 domain-containing protein n=1 Tax=Bosea sp. (in: a-proteobacteria) TaxID=1871050 RepID=UPI002632C87E|nr:hypothetical protein [Bosea sp. (in: a-proteobacteria)]MCO5092634.1 hypothetical protein [Bosea sp. (in: a-proteobacteria)]